MSKEEVSDKLSGVSINVDPKLKIIFHTDVVVHIDEQKAEIKSDPEAVQSQKPEPIDLKKDLKETQRSLSKSEEEEEEEEEDS